MPDATQDRFDDLLVSHGGRMCWEQLPEGGVEIEPCISLIHKYDPELYDKLVKAGNHKEPRIK